MRRGVYHLVDAFEVAAPGLLTTLLTLGMPTALNDALGFVHDGVSQQAGCSTGLILLLILTIEGLRFQSRPKCGERHDAHLSLPPVQEEVRWSTPHYNA